jgi:PAS domain S-box-containing protein
MKIRTQLIISIALFCVALLIIAASMVMTNQQVDQLNRQQELVKNIELGAGELGYLSNDYLLYNENQQLDRWNSKYAEFSGDVSNLSVNSPEQQVLVDTIKAGQQRLKDVFSDVVLTLNDGNLASGNGADKEYIQVSWSRLAVQTRGIIFDASRLSEMLDDQKNDVKQTSNTFILVLLGAFGAFILIDYLLVFGGAIKSIGNLQAGTKIIGSGNLDYTIKTIKGNEIGELAEAFNQMTARLKTVTTSKADLEKEVAERKRAEEALRESRAKLQAVFESMNDAVFVSDTNGNFIDFNEGFATFYKFRNKEECYKTLAEYPDYIDVYFADGTLAPLDMWAVPRALRGETVSYAEYILQRKDTGEKWWGSYSFGPIKDRDGNIVGSVVVGRDITERKRSEEYREQLVAQLKAKTSELQDMNEEVEVKNEELAAQAEELECANEELRMNNDELQSVTRSLRETKEYLENLINYANAPIIVWDPCFNITRFNHAFERLSGYTANEVIGKNLSLLFPADSSDDSLNKIKKTLEGEKWESVEIPILHKYGSVRIVLWNSANIYGDNQNLLATIAQGQDITARKQAEKELQEAKAQAELYLDLMGHDISNLHQIMMMQLELASDILEIEEKLEGEDRELIDSSLRTLEKASRLINNVRKLQKYRSGEYSQEPMNLAVMLKDVLKDYENLPGKDVTIKFNPDGKSMVRASPLLKDVFSNLVDNAVKHSSGQLVLGIDISKVGLNGGSYYRVTIEDNGNGIPDDRKEEVFHRFKRGQTKARGTGLGLYIVKTLVEGFGGYVEVQNRVLNDYTQGTRFLVYLPVAEEDNGGIS